VSALEGRYRAALRWYPKAWRRRNEDAVIGTLLDLAEEDGRSLPRPGELANLHANGIAARLGILGRIPVGVRERAATLALGLGVTIAAAGILDSADMARTLPDLDRSFVSTFGLFQNIGVVFYGLWVAGFIASVIGLRRTTATLLISSIGASFALPLISDAAYRLGNTGSITLGLLDLRTIGALGHPGSVTLGFLDLLAVVVLVGRPALRGRPRWPLVVSTLGFATAFLLILWARKTGYWGNGALGVDWFWGQFAIWLTFLGIPLALGAAALAWHARRSLWSPAILLATVPVLTLPLVEFDYKSAWLGHFAIVGGIALLVVALLGAARLAGLRIRVTRR
jgi:hypothetical protein